METISCIFGHGPSNDVVIEENGFKGRRCPVCRTIFISPRPELVEVFDLYHHDRAYLPSSHHIQFNPGAELAAKFHFHAIFKNNPMRGFNKCTKRYSILEIGCGGGHLLKLAKEQGMDAYGVELNPYQADHVRTALGIPCESSPFSAQTFGGRKFDIIFHCDVISHLYDPISDLIAMRQKLEDGGQVIFETGNGADINPRYYKYFRVWQYPDHLFFFGESSIRDLLKRAGFSSVASKTWSILPQMALSRWFGSINRSPGSVPAKKQMTPDGISANHSWRYMLKRRIAARGMHFVRHAVGSVSSNPEVPRSMIVWATR